MIEMPRVWHPIAPKTKKFTLHIISLAVRRVGDGHCTVLVVGSDDVAVSYSTGVL